MKTNTPEEIRKTFCDSLKKESVFNENGNFTNQYTIYLEYAVEEMSLMLEKKWTIEPGNNK